MSFALENMFDAHQYDTRHIAGDSVKRLNVERHVHAIASLRAARDTVVDAASLLSGATVDSCLCR